MPKQKTLAVQKLRQKYSLEILLSVAQLPRATFYYSFKENKRRQINMNLLKQKSKQFFMKTKEDMAIAVLQLN